MHWLRRHDRGRPPHPDVLTPAEWRVLAHMREGLTNAEIAVRLGVSVNTVRTHVSSMLAKTGLADREALARWPGSPAPASRVALARERSPLLAPLAWLRAHARAAGVAAGTIVGVGALVLLAATMPRAVRDGAIEANPTPSPPFRVAEPTASPTPNLKAKPAPAPRTPLVHPGVSPPSPSLDAQGWPQGAVGPLVLYRIARDARSPATPTTYEYVLADLGAARQVASFEVAGGALQSALAGTRLFVSYVEELWTYALDGSGGRRLVGGGDDPRHIESMAVNADGSLLAVTHYRAGSVSHEDLVLDVIDVASGDVTFRSTNAEGVAAGMQGVLSVLRWSADSQTLLVAGNPMKEAPYHFGTVGLDGIYRFLDDYLPAGEQVDPLGEQLTVDLGGQCGDPMSPYLGWSSIELRDPTTGTMLNRVEADSPAYEVMQRSPDGRELLYREHALPPDLTQALISGGCDGSMSPPCVGGTKEPEVLPDGRCRSSRGLEAARQSLFILHILSADGEPPIEVSSVREAYERWFGDRLITFVCEGEEAAGEPMGDYLTRRAGFQAPTCPGSPQELRIGGQPIDAGYDIEVLSFVDRP